MVPTKDTYNYLKHSGMELDVKITIRKLDNGQIIICIRDSEFKSIGKALRYLQHIAETEFSGIF